MHKTPFVILCLAAAVRSTDAVAPEDEHDDGDKADMLFQVHSSGRVQHAAQEDAPLEESQLEGSRQTYGCDRHTVRTRIRNDEVENELSYARTGSQLPAGFHGIWWMDQRGTNVGRSTTGRNYQANVAHAAADEFLVTFGDASWDAGSQCVRSVPVFGGRKGHWTWADGTGSLGNSIYDLNCGIQLAFDFCCKDRNCNTIDILGHCNARDAMEYIASPAFHGLGGGGSLLMGPILWGIHWWNGHSETFWLPTNIQSWQMIKKPWGYDRLTTLCPDCWWDWQKTFYHYPLFQIVDGNGHRTQHYEAYLRHANHDTHRRSNSFPLNRGNGTSFVGRDSR